MIYLYGNEAKEFQMKNTAIALGKFDGIHIGHQLLIEGLKEEQTKGKHTLVFSFGNQPNAILNGEEGKRIYTTEEKVQYFNHFSIDVLLEYPFTKEFASLLPEDFIRDCLVKHLDVQSIYVGQDFRFGQNRSGNVALLKKLGEKYGFQVHSVQKKKLKNRIVSSTAIRQYLKEDFSLANDMLGNPYFVYGPVIHGNHLGNTIGFPTINQELSENKILPEKGVYISRIWIGQEAFYGISNLGVKPTIKGVHKTGLETYILDFSGDLYGQKIKTELLSFIRKEKKFDSIEALKDQIQKDIQLGFKMSGKNT